MTQAGAAWFAVRLTVTTVVPPMRFRGGPENQINPAYRRISHSAVSRQTSRINTAG